jgi:hypothetical protein
MRPKRSSKVIMGQAREEFVALSRDRLTWKLSIDYRETQERNGGLAKERLMRSQDRDKTRVAYSILAYQCENGSHSRIGVLLYQQQMLERVKQQNGDKQLDANVQETLRSCCAPYQYSLLYETMGKNSNGPSGETDPSACSRRAALQAMT